MIKHAELRFEQNYFDFLRDHPCHIGLPDYAEEDALSALTWFCVGAEWYSQPDLSLTHTHCPQIAYFIQKKV